jgi:hypothetical protein
MARSIDEIRRLYPYSDNCFAMEKTIGKIINEKSFYALKMNSGEISVLDRRLTELNDFFAKKNCEMVLGNKKIEEVLEISKKYGEIDKIRIETQSIAERNKRVYIGIGIVLAGAGIILITNKK